MDGGCSVLNVLVSDDQSGAVDKYYLSGILPDGPAGLIFEKSEYLTVHGVRCIDVMCVPVLDHCTRNFQSSSLEAVILQGFALTIREAQSI